MRCIQRGMEDEPGEKRPPSSTELSCLLINSAEGGEHTDSSSRAAVRRKVGVVKTGSIALVVIVKNEAERIVSLLTHHKGLVQEMIVLDTGSTDETVALARSAGATVHFFDPRRTQSCSTIKLCGRQSP